MKSLDEIMSFGHVIRVKDDGTIEDSDNPTGIESVYVDTDNDGQILAKHEKVMISQVGMSGWEFVTGYSAQWQYGGPIMHASEYIGGALEEYIRETAGFFVAVTVETLDDHEEPAGWAVLYREDPPTFASERTEEYRTETCANCGDEIERQWLRKDGEWCPTRWATLCSCDAVG